MARRREEKERLRRERQAQEQEEQERARRRQRLYGFGAAGVLIIAATLAIVVVVAAGGGDGESGPASGAGSLSSTNTDGLADRRKGARVPTMAEASVVGAAHFHPQLRIYVNGKQIKIPANIGIDPDAPPSDMAGLHTHDDSGTIHNEAGTEAKLRQLFAVWGVPLSSTRLGPYRATKRKKVMMWVDDKPSREFGNLQLEDGQQIVIAYGTKAQGALLAKRRP